MRLLSSVILDPLYRIRLNQIIDDFIYIGSNYWFGRIATVPLRMVGDPLRLPSHPICSHQNGRENQRFYYPSIVEEIHTDNRGFPQRPYRMGIVGVRGYPE